MSDYQGMERWPDDRLLRAASRGNAAAFETLCVKRLPSLLKYVRYQCRSWELPSNLAEDLCQDTFIRAVECLAASRENGGRPLPKFSVAWLKQIAFNLMKDWRRKNRRVTFVEAVVETSRPEINPDIVEEYEEIVKFFQWLGDDHRDMLEMVLVEGKGIVEAGDMLGLNKWAAYKAYERALGALRDLHREHGRVACPAMSRDGYP